MNNRFFAILFLISITVSYTYSKGNNHSSHKVPEWVKKGEEKYNHQKNNDSYYFKIIENTGNNLESVRNQNVLALASYIGQVNHISSTTKTDISHNASTGEEHDITSISYSNDASTEVFLTKLVDEYWKENNVDGTIQYDYYALFAVSAQDKNTNFDHFSKTTQYGMNGLVRSLIPGVGQIYKGSKLKGTSIMAGEALLVGGIIYSESMRSSYHKKMIEQPKHAGEYNSLADNWQTARTIFSSAAVALYIYNLIDAAVANGARRIVIKKNTNWGVSLRPTIYDTSTGISLCVNF